MISLRSVNFGGGQQSMAQLVLAKRGVIDFRTFMFAHVGLDSENPETLTYFYEHAAPYAEKHGIEMVEIRRVMVRTGETRTLYDEISRPGSLAQKIPVKLSNGRPGSRACTHDYKIAPIGRELQRRGASPENPATVAMGISLDEIHRANEGKAQPYERLVYPLLELRLRRSDCVRVIQDEGLPVPPSSSCWFCPNHSPEAWHNLRRTRPDLFERSCRLEELMNQRLAKRGKPPVFFTRFQKPLREAIPDGVDLLPMFDEDDSDCDSGMCFT